MDSTTVHCIIRTQHIELLDTVGGETTPFVELDNRFHSLLNAASDNRLMQVMQEAMFYIFHFHYRWGSDDEKARNVQAMAEHLQIIDALLDRDEASATEALGTHLSTAQKTLLGRFAMAE